MNLFESIASIATASAVLINVLGITPSTKEAVLAERSLSLENRYEDVWVNGIFKDNILLTIAYLKEGVKNQPIVWEDITKPFSYEFTLRPYEMFTFHDDVLPEYKEKVKKTTNAHFNAQEGFKSDGYLYGDGVCHLASLLYWVAKDAKLQANAPVNHNFRAIPDIPKEYGVSIYSLPGQSGVNAQQNLYITNTLKKPVTFRFVFDGKTLTLTLLPAS